MAKATKQFSLEHISQSRGLLMGLATLWVVLSHSHNIDFAQSHILAALHLTAFFQNLQAYGSAGVDLFLLLSGYGLWYSYSKNPGIKAFYARRFSRILPALFIVTILYYGWQGTDGLGDYMAKNLHYALYHPTYSKGEFWYFSLIIVLYLAYPLLHKIIRRWGLLGAIGLSLVSIGGTFLFRQINFAYFDKMDVALTRLPIFFFGIWIGKKSKEGTGIPVWIPITCCIVFPALLMLLPHIPLPGFFMLRYLFAPLVLSLAFAVCWLDSWIPSNLLKRFIVLIGVYSMEIYLTYETLNLHMGGVFKASDGVGITYALACFVLSLLLAFALKKSSEIIVNGLKK